MKAYTASLAFIDGCSETAHVINFKAASDIEAVRGVWTWIRNRRENVTEVFDEIGAIKIWNLNLQTFESSGYLPPSTGACVYEWKYDWGYPEGDTSMLEEA